MRSTFQSQIAVAVVAVLCGGASLAQGFDGQRYDPPAGAAGGLAVERPVVPKHLGFGLGIVANYANEPVVLRDRDLDGTIRARPLEHALTVDLLASIALLDVIELALDLPLNLVYDGDASAAGATASRGVGDLRLLPKVAFTLGRRVKFALGAAVPITFPTGSPSAMRGEGGLTANPMALLGVRGSSWGVSANAGYRLRRGAARALLGDELTLGLAYKMALVPRSDLLDLMIEATSASYLGESRSVANLPIELFAGLGIKPHPSWTIDVGGAGGITRGLGDPRFRVIAGVRYTPNPATDYKDADGDGVPDNVDRCPNKPEDADGFQDEDGCPEHDNDRDGVPDDRDECPEEPGRGDGCPDGDAYLESGRISIRGKVQFETGSSNIKPKSQRLLDRVAQLMKQNPDLKVRIEGHTDDVGDARPNQELSEERARSVRQALIKRGVAPNRLVARGYGESRPVAPNKTAAGRARNRRVEFIRIN